MLPRRPLRTLLTILAFLASSLAGAQTAAPQPDWGCWVSDPEGRFQVHYLRCVAMNESTTVSKLRKSQPDWQLLEFIRTLIKTGRVERIERLLDSPDSILPYGALWQSRIDTFPFEEDWTAGLPEQLARATLCVDPAACSLFVQRQ